MKTNSVELPKNIDLQKWKDNDFSWSGKLDSAYFSRISKQINNEHSDETLQVSCQLETINNVLWLSFTVQGVLYVQCQRCLEPLNIDLDKSQKIALLNSEEQIRILEDESDYLLLDELIDADDKKQLISLSTIMEDEILLDIPLSPKHDDCELAVDSVGEITEIKNENPFAALAQLKGSL